MADPSTGNAALGFTKGNPGDGAYTTYFGCGAGNFSVDTIVECAVTSTTDGCTMGGRRNLLAQPERKDQTSSNGVCAASVVDCDGCSNDKPDAVTSQNQIKSRDY